MRACSTYVAKTALLTWPIASTSRKRTRSRWTKSKLSTVLMLTVSIGSARSLPHEPGRSRFANKSRPARQPRDMQRAFDKASMKSEEASLRSSAEKRAFTAAVRTWLFSLPPSKTCPAGLRGQARPQYALARGHQAEDVERGGVLRALLRIPAGGCQGRKGRAPAAARDPRVGRRRTAKLRAPPARARAGSGLESEPVCRGAAPVATGAPG